MEQDDIERFKIERGADADPIIVLTGTEAEFIQFCNLTNRGYKTALAIRQGYQLPSYPDLPIVCYGTYWLNTAYDSPEYRDRINKLKFQEIENESNNLN